MLLKMKACLHLPQFTYSSNKSPKHICCCSGSLCSNSPPVGKFTHGRASVSPTSYATAAVMFEYFKTINSVLDRDQPEPHTHKHPATPLTPRPRRLRALGTRQVRLHFPLGPRHTMVVRSGNGATEAARPPATRRGSRPSCAQ